MSRTRWIMQVGLPAIVTLAVFVAACGPAPATHIRVMTYNIEDVRTPDVSRLDHPRLLAAARTIQEIRPDILLINEMTYAGAISGAGGDPELNARLFVENYLSVSQAPGLEPLAYETYAPATNTGIASGFDLNNDGEVVTTYPAPDTSGPDGAPPRQTAEQRAYGNDSWGFGTFPGQYAMALFVSPEMEILRDSIRTFRTFLWRDMPGALEPIEPDSVTPWYDYLEWSEMRLSSKNHVDVPVRLPTGQILHVLASHPTPPAFDGPERRNKLRNHDEIRFWIDYIVGADYFVDDAGKAGGLSAGSPFVIVGDLNADPDEGSSYDNPAAKLLTLAAVNGDFVPMADEEGVAAYPDLDADDTAEWGLRIDYVLPSRDFEVAGGHVYRPAPNEIRASDHFPVWLDLRLLD